ncbi:MAG: hypothetical protein ACKVOP_00715 [Sphingomonadaceae bacterium]
MIVRLIVVAALAFPLAARAQTAPSLPRQVTALQECRTKTDAAERLRCYDQAVDALTAATQSRDVIVVDRAEVKEARRGLFGFTLPKIGFLSSSKAEQVEADDDREIVTKVIASRSFNRDQWRFTVEDGAVWETTEVSRGFDDPKPGATVTLSRGTLGAYYATVGKRGRATVRRIK